MATYTTYDEVGIKEDVSDIIVNISPTETPFHSGLKTEKVTQTHPQWQEDALAAAATNAQIEGADAPAASQSPTVMRSNYTQIFSKTVKVSGTADVVQAHGRARESAYQMAKKMKEIKRDLEYAIVGSSHNFTVGDSSTTARVMASAPFMVDAGNVVDANNNPLAENNLLTAMNDLYTVGGEASIFMIKPGDALKVAAWAEPGGGRERFVDGAATKVTNAVAVYQSPWGTVRVVMNRFMLTSIAMVYDPSYWRLLVLRNWFREVLAKTGDSLNQQLIGEFSIKHSNFKASAEITNLT